MTRPIAIVVLGPSGMDTARRAAGVLPGSSIHGLARRIVDADTTFTDVTGHLRTLFADGIPIVGVCAAGILIRALAPRLEDKGDEPPVLALAEDASAIVPLLGGHHGANDIARKLGDAFGVAPAITTAGDLRFGVALDDPPPGWHLANPEHVKPFMAEMLSGKTVRIVGDAPWLTESGIELDLAGELQISVSLSDLGGNDKHLVYNPRSVAIGVGCERGLTTEELVGLVDDTISPTGLSKNAVAGIYSIDLKADEQALHEFATTYQVPLRFFDATTLEAESPRLVNPSDVVFRAVGCHGVAEGAALAATGANGRLRVPKHKSKRATCAMAAAPEPFDPMTVGKARGWLGIVGTGPGASEWLTPEATAMLSRATDVVGYGLYLDLVGDHIAGKARHEYPLGEEEIRVRAALDLAAEGREVALVSSGDPGIYAMATLAYELIDREKRADWRRVDVVTAPGISALQAAAARAGAPLGHDFCTVSLSDLMTPWPVIERRVKAAAEADFVLALYNPVSRRRDWQLARSREILLEHRPTATPVVIARNLGREGERIRVTTLDHLDPKTVDMLTVVLIGSSETRTIDRADGQSWVYTPRGYGDAAKTGEAP